MLKDVLKTVNEYLETITDLVKTLVIIGIIVEIIFPNRFKTALMTHHPSSIIHQPGG